MAAVSNKVFKTGRVVVVLHGRMAGKKAVVLSAYDSGNRERSFSHALVVGIEKAPQKITKKMSEKKIEKKCTTKVFLKHINYSHLMPTRYVIGNMDAKRLIGERKIETAAEKQEAKKNIGNILKETFLTESTGADSKSRDLAFLRKPLRF